MKLGITNSFPPPPILVLKAFRDMATLKWITFVLGVVVLVAVTGVGDRVAPHWTAFLRGFWLEVRPW